jgi:hypothetical protein
VHSFREHQHFAFDPRVGFRQAIPQTDGRLPVKISSYLRVIAVAPIYTFRGLQVVIPLHLYFRNVLYDVHQLIDRNQLIASEIERLVNFTLEDRLDAFKAIVYVHETAGLVTIPPDFDFVISGNLRFHQFPADGCRSLLTSARPSPVRAVNIVETSDSALDTEVFFEVSAHAFAEQFFPAIAIFGRCGIGVFLLQRDDIRVSLLLAVVNACR